MPGLFDQVGAHLSPPEDSDAPPVLYKKMTTQIERSDEGGITTLDLISLAQPQKQIMLFMLRDHQATLEGIALDAIAERMPTPPDDLTAHIKALIHTGWLIPLGEPPNQRYRVHMRRKRGSKLGFGIWSIINERVPRQKDE